MSDTSSWAWRRRVWLSRDSVHPRGALTDGSLDVATIVIGQTVMSYTGPYGEAVTIPRDQSTEFERRVARIAWGALAFSSAASLAFALAVGGSVGDVLEILGTATIVGGAAAVSGALLGFLFGIPRTLQRESAPTSEAPTIYLANTNLEQISDWLTKILVGITLVQIGSIGPKLAELASALGPMLGGSAASPGFGLALCVYSFVAAFLIAYLWTRVLFRRELAIADMDLESTVRAVVDDQSNADAVAFSMVERQLNGQGAVSPDDLAAALGKSSGFARVQVYQRAEQQRSNNWRRGRDGERELLHERTIPVFRALVAIDPEGEFHRNHGSLGFALKDAKLPDYASALEELTTAITIRGPAATGGFSLYEWNRAVCRILTSPSQRDPIVADLRVAAQRLGESLFSASASDPGVNAVADWLSINGLSYEELRA